MIILGIFKELRDCVIIKNDNGDVEIKGASVDEGTEEERTLIKSIFLSQGFRPAEETITTAEVISQPKKDE